MATRTITITVDVDQVSSAVEEVLEVIKGSRYLAGSVVKVGYTDQGRHEITDRSAWAYSRSQGEARKRGIALARAVDAWSRGIEENPEAQLAYVKKAQNLLDILEGHDPRWSE